MTHGSIEKMDAAPLEIYDGMRITIDGEDYTLAWTDNGRAGPDNEYTVFIAGTDDAVTTVYAGEDEKTVVTRIRHDRLVWDRIHSWYAVAMAHEDDGSLRAAGYVYRTRKQAEARIRAFEAEDRRNGCYDPDSYTVVEVEAPRESEEFTAQITAHGNSLDIKVTAPARRMGLDRGDLVRVRLERI